MHPAMQRRRHRLMIRRTTSRSGRRKGVTTFFLAFGILVAAFVGGSVLGTGGAMFAAYNYFASDLPAPNILDDIQLPQSTLVYDRTGKTLLARFECQNRESVAFKDVPKWVVDATVATEDRTFWTNTGIDLNATIRAFLANAAAGHIVQGASTITQQVIKYAGSIKEAQAKAPSPSALPSAQAQAEAQATAQAKSVVDVCKPPELTFLSSRGYVDKIKENILALQVTAAYPGQAGKEKILETYLNLIFYGNGSYGIKAAAANYFGITDLDKLTLAQAAFLAGIPQQPTTYDPYQNPHGAAPVIVRRNQVLDAMLVNGYITKAEHDKAVATTWKQMHPSRVTSILKEPQFSFRVEDEAEQILAKLGYKNPAQEFRTGGFRVITTLDYRLQQTAKAEVTRWVNQLKPKNVNNAALVALNSATGEIIAYVGSVDYYNRKDPRVQGQFDVAGLGRRQIGSAFKPITYTSAFQSRKVNVATMLVDATTDFGRGYIPQNADLNQHGPLLAMDALHYSLNVPSVQVQYLVSPEVTARFAQKAGLATHDYLMGQDPGLTLTLGSVPVNLTQATQAYEMFAERGTIHPATTIREIRDRNGRLVYSIDDNAPTPLKPATPAEAYLTHWILEGNTDPARNIYWGVTARLSTQLDGGGERRHAGVKTGTTNNFRDVTTFGYLPGSIVTGVWMGNNNQEPMADNLFAATGPLYLWHEFMNLAINKPWDWNGKKIVPQTDFPMPDGVSMQAVCRWTGLAPSGACGRTISVPFLDGTAPKPDDSWVNGCLDLVKFVQEQGRPAPWATAAKTFEDRVVNGQWGSSGNVRGPNVDPSKVKFPIAPIPGERGFPSLCGTKHATPAPSPSGKPRGSGSPGPSGFCLHKGKLTPCPSALPGPTQAAAPNSGAGIPVLPFAIPAIAGAAPYLRRCLRFRRH
jgi:membrane peptidoglycan carboxypeptidase